MKRIIETSDRVISNNLESYLLASNSKLRRQGKAWYKDAQKFAKQMSKKYNVEPFRVAGVISALSPNNQWKRNKFDAEQLISYYREGGTDWVNVKICTYKKNRERAWNILTQGERITSDSPKIHSFAMNVGNKSPDHVTIDKWHMRASLARPREGITLTQESPTKLQYKRVEGITLDIARMHKLKGYELQAIVWVTIKEKWNRQ